MIDSGELEEIVYSSITTFTKPVHSCYRLRYVTATCGGQTTLVLVFGGGGGGVEDGDGKYLGIQITERELK